MTYSRSKEIALDVLTEHLQRNLFFCLSLQLACWLPWLGVSRCAPANASRELELARRLELRCLVRSLKNNRKRKADGVRVGMRFRCGFPLLRRIFLVLEGVLVENSGCPLSRPSCHQTLKVSFDPWAISFRRPKWE